MKRTRDRELLALAAVRAGHSLTSAAANAGVSYITLIRWRARGRVPHATPAQQQFTMELESALNN